MKISGKAKLAFVMGCPVGHSLSPRLHNYWLEKYGIDGAYVPLEASPRNLGSVISALPLMGFRGGNITIPHKEEALKLAGKADETAKKAGAANTLVFENGDITAYNTDIYGFAASLEEQGFQGDKAVVLGAGGAARAVVLGLLAKGVKDITVINRTAERAVALSQEFGVSWAMWENREEALIGAALLVNTTSLGMVNHPPLELGLSALPPSALVFDIIYNPRETALLAAAKARGNKTANGLDMLIHQAVPGFELWFGVRPEVTPELKTCLLSS